MGVILHLVFAYTHLLPSAYTHSPFPLLHIQQHRLLTLREGRFCARLLLWLVLGSLLVVVFLNSPFYFLSCFILLWNKDKRRREGKEKRKKRWGHKRRKRGKEENRRERRQERREGMASHCGVYSALETFSTFHVETLFSLFPDI